MTPLPPDPTPGRSSSIGLERHLYWFVPMLLAAALSAPHLSHPFHHDEIYTELNFAMSFEKAFLDYHIPNNHILFSALWHIWRMVVDDPLYWRFLPFTCFLLTVVCVAAAGRRWTGRIAGGWLAGLVFATMHPAISYGTELRGYSQSMTLAAFALYALGRWREDGRNRWAVFYGVAGFLAIGTVPTNLATFAAMAVAFSVVDILETRGGVPRGLPRTAWGGFRGRLLWLGLIPATGLVFLLPNWAQLSESAKHGSNMVKSLFLWHFPTATMRDFLWLPIAVFLIVELWLLQRRTAPGSGIPPRGDWRVPLAWIFCALAPPMFLCLIQRETPNDYTLPATLPAIALGLGWLTTVLLRYTPESAAAPVADPIADPKATLVAAESEMKAGALTMAPEGVSGVGGSGLAAELFRRFRLSLLILAALGLALLGIWRENGGANAPLSVVMYDSKGIDIAGLNLYYQEFQGDDFSIQLVDWLYDDHLKAERPQTVVFLLPGDPLLPKVYWAWRHAEAAPEVTTAIFPDEIQGLTYSNCRKLWNMHQRRLIVTYASLLPPPDFFEVFSPDVRGHLHFVKNFKLFDVYEWRAGPLPPGDDPRSIAL